MISLRELLEDMMQQEASDLHLTAGLPPQYRVDGDILSSKFDVMSPDDTRAMAYSILNDDQKKHFENDKELDLSFGVQGMSRFRANVYLQRGVTSMAIRRIPYEIMTFESLGLPRVIGNFAKLHRGMFLVTGPTGSGKSTTLASIVDWINEHRVIF
jgi:twitching motility protein PilT